MNTRNNSFSKILSKMKSLDFIYSSIILLFFILVLVLFIYSTSFILKNINKMFSVNQPGNIETLDIARYSLVAKKLNLPSHIPGGSPPPSNILPPAPTSPIPSFLIPATPATPPAVVPAPTTTTPANAPPVPR